MGDRKLKPRKGADFPQVTQLVGLRAGARSQALPPNPYFVMFSEAWRGLGTTRASRVHLHTPGGLPLGWTYS